jgi:hypothetical protein
MIVHKTEEAAKKTDVNGLVPAPIRAWYTLFRLFLSQTQILLINIVRASLKSDPTFKHPASCEALYQCGLDTSGVFRIPGNAKRVAAVSSNINHFS